MPKSKKFLPASIIALRHYSLQTFSADLIAGVTVGLVALPLAMAFAISSGLPPQAGIYTAVVTGFIISALGGTGLLCALSRNRSCWLSPAASPSSS